MMTNAFSAANGKAEYMYNGFRGRVAKLENMNKVDYVLDPTLPYDNLLVENGQKFIWGNGLISSSGDESFNYLQDHLGSPIRLVGDSGIDEALTYDEFGKQMTGSAGKFDNPFTFTGEHQSLSGGFSNGSQPFGFTGYQSDNVSGMLYAQARYYQPNIGRFGAQDIVRDGLNWYVFCGNDPINYFDPDGLCRQCARDYMETFGPACENNPRYPAMTNPNFPFWSLENGGNCANFVSQSLLAGGGDPILYEWFITTPIVANNWFTRGSMSAFAFQNRTFASRDIFFNDVLPSHQVLVSASWNNANAQFNFFSNPQNGFINGESIRIDRYSNLEQILRDNNIQVGDLLHMDLRPDSRGRRGTKDHAVIISYVRDGEIYMAGNTADWLEMPLTYWFAQRLATDPNLVLHITMLNDSMFECG